MSFHAIAEPYRWTMAHLPDAIKARLGGNSSDDIQGACTKLKWLSRCEKVTQATTMGSGFIATASGTGLVASYFPAFGDLLSDYTSLPWKLECSLKPSPDIETWQGCSVVHNFLQYVPIVLLISTVLAGISALATKLLASQQQSIRDRLTDRNWGYVPAQICNV